MHTIELLSTVAQAAGGLTGFLDGKIEVIKTLVQSTALVLGIAGVALAYAHTKAIIPTLVALLTGALLYWGVTHMDTWFKDRLDEESTSGPAHAVAPLVPVERPAPRFTLEL
jgi:hypothetical protein